MDEPGLIAVVTPFTTLRDMQNGELGGNCPFCGSHYFRVHTKFSRIVNHEPPFVFEPVDRPPLWSCLGCCRGGDVQQFLKLIRAPWEGVTE